MHDGDIDVTEDLGKMQTQTWSKMAIVRFAWKRTVDVTEDLGKMQTQTWSKMAFVRDAWKRIVDHAKTHKEL